MTNALPTLLHPFESGILELSADTRVLFLGAPGDLRLPTGFPRGVVAVQGFRPDWLALKARGVDVRTEPGEGGFDAVLVLCTRFRAANETSIGEALSSVRAGGLIVVAGGKQDGAASLRKRIEPILPVDGHASKHHGVVFWLRRPDDATAQQAAEALDHPPQLVEGRFVTGAGMFSADGVDPASRMLAEHLPPGLKGDVADFCAGWGYLAAQLAAGQSLRSLDLYEADHASLEAARQNLASATCPTGFHWHDLAAEPVVKRYDAIVMNPPFHAGRAAEPEIGKRMIAAAAKALRKGGTLYLVANRNLPYEREMAALFSAHGETFADTRFKVLWGRR